MVNIDPLQAAIHAGSQLQASQTKTKKTEDPKKKSLFSKLLSERVKEETSLSSLPPELASLPYEKALEALVDSVYLAGDKLKEKPHTDSFVAYKKAIGQFLRFVVDEAYETEKQEGIIQKNSAGIPYKKEFTVVKTVNEELDKLARDILYNQLDQMKLTARVDEITGLLVNIFS